MKKPHERPSFGVLLCATKDDEVVEYALAMDKSTGTRAFIADCNRLLDRCVTQAPKGDAAETREAIEIAGR